MKWVLVKEKALEYFRFRYKGITALYSLRADHDAVEQRFKPVFLKQIHSDVIVDIDDEPKREGDGLITEKKDVCLGIKVADCLPVYLFNDRRISVIHCGWRGIVKGIAKKAKQRLVEYRYVLGASIGPCCYEIQEDVKELFSKEYPSAVIHRGDKIFLDLKAAVVKDLGEQNLLASLNYCTRCRPEYFYSYRRGDVNKRDYALLVSR
ncbi:MAG TPA: laccase domain-containing protein [candidate division WOR-3 bacterium]|uniref:Laccase domain-containing protein n=1 Tax=candidate division WOR-3 bacterium TaxID=2052148 RepID=A0A9C9ENM7_UNCW3|nr:laccase domain-containing protein [candidate division WOR-3 bacterium]